MHVSYLKDLESCSSFWYIERSKLNRIELLCNLRKILKLLTRPFCPLSHKARPWQRLRQQSRHAYVAIVSCRFIPWQLEPLLFSEEISQLRVPSCSASMRFRPSLRGGEQSFYWKSSEQMWKKCNHLSFFMMQERKTWINLKKLWDVHARK